MELETLPSHKTFELQFFLPARQAETTVAPWPTHDWFKLWPKLQKRALTCPCLDGQTGHPSDQYRTKQNKKKNEMIHNIELYSLIHA